MEVSNRFLAALLIVAIVVSLGGTMVSLNQLKFVQPLSGMSTAQDSGQVALNITAQAAVQFTVAGLNFGTGWVNATGVSTDDHWGPEVRNCTMTINGTSKNPSTSYGTYCRGDWGAESGWSDWTTDAKPLIIENIGTTILKINVSSNKDKDTMFNSSDSTAAGMENFQWNIRNNETDSCGVGLAHTSWTNITANANATFCNCLNTSQQISNNSLALGFKVVVPWNVQNDYIGSTNNATITVNGIDQGVGTCS